MRIPPFEFKAPGHLDQALALLGRAGQGATLLAGGTDLVLGLKKKTLAPDLIISLQNLNGLDDVREENGMICIGAMATHETLAKHPLLQERADILCQAVGLIGSWQIRNAGTIGGNICNASPAGDALPPLLALDARFIVAGPDGEATLPATSFFKGPGETCLGRDRILTQVQIPLPPEHSAGCYMKLRRRKAVDISIAGVAFQAAIDDTGQQIARAGIALGGVAPTPVRVGDAEDLVRGCTIDQALGRLGDIAQCCADAARPIDDIRASAHYKRTIVNVFAQRCARHVLTRLKSKRG